MSVPRRSCESTKVTDPFPKTQTYAESSAEFDHTNGVLVVSSSAETKHNYVQSSSNRLRKTKPPIKGSKGTQKQLPLCLLCDLILLLMRI